MMSENEAIIEIRELRKKYKSSDEEALKGINLKIKRGEFFGLLGPNSAGKTTLISLMCGLLKISGGSITINGINIEGNSKKLSGIIGLVPQELALYPTLTIRENLNFFGEMHGISGKRLKVAVDEMLDVIKLKEHENKLISKCSGGIKRRTNLIAGLIHKPMILFLDEPTLGVDVQSRNLIFEYLQHLNKTGTTIIYTTHYMAEVESFCSEMMILDNGKIIIEGTPKELIAENQECRNLGELFLKLTGRDLRD